MTGKISKQQPLQFFAQAWLKIYSKIYHTYLLKIAQI